MYDVTPAGIREAGFGVDIPASDAVDIQLAQLIAKAETRIAVAVPTLAARVESGGVAIEVVRGVIEDMVLRVVKNPRSLRSLGIDDFQATIDTSASSGLLYLTDDELAMLAPASRGSVGSIRIGIPTWRLPGE